MERILSVSELNNYINSIFLSDAILTSTTIKGEISNFKNHYSGHLYFTLKDEKSLIKCIMFRSYAQSLRFLPEDGLKVLARGYVSVYEKDGQYQLYIRDLQPEGVGSLYIAFEQLKKKLQKEGLFDTDRKKKLPLLPAEIGIITSKTGAVLRDIINISTRRFPGIHLKIFPVAVQGPGSASQIVHAIESFNEKDNVDVIIIARGGGSIEELWSFNEEIVARSIYKSRIPVISAVGHETDYTIVDFVADLRAPTPSAAAEIAVPEKIFLKDKLLYYTEKMKASLLRNLEIQKNRYNIIKSHRNFKQPEHYIDNSKVRLDSFIRLMIQSTKSKASSEKIRLTSVTYRLDSLNPYNVLKRGYSVVRFREKPDYPYSCKEILLGDKLTIIMHDGDIHAEVEY